MQATFLTKFIRNGILYNISEKCYSFVTENGGSIDTLHNNLTVGDLFAKTDAKRATKLPSSISFTHLGRRLLHDWRFLALFA